ncbi:MAG: sugar phosphate isomerase/epimerase family protein [Spirochaetota bacterium]
MKFGVNTFLFESPFTTESIEHLKVIQQLGFDGVEIAYENKGDMDLEKVSGAIKEQGLECCAVCGAFGPDRDLRGGTKEQENSNQYIRDCIDACEILGAGILAGPLYSSVGRAGMETPENKKKQWETVVENLREVCKYAENKGITLGIEPLNRFETDFINICTDARRLIEDVNSSALKIHLDTFHMNIEEKSLPMAVLEAGELLCHVHASENDRGAPGTGTVDWKGVKDALNKINYNGYMVIESFTPDVEIIARAASIWRQTEQSNVELSRKGLMFLKGLFSS